MLPEYLFTFLSVLIHSSMQLDRLYEGDTCRNDDGVQGVCKRLKVCTTGFLAIKAGKHPKICSFIEDQPVVCCPPEGNSKPQGNKPRPKPWRPSDRPDREQQSRPHPDYAVAKAKQKCIEYAKTIIVEIEDPALTASSDNRKDTVDLCARIEEPLVLGGEDAKPREYPHMALIGYRQRPIKWLCGGSLISERFVVSAAHCSSPAREGPAMWVKLGELDQSTDLDDAEPQTIRIIQRIDHPGYKPPVLYNDITLFKLERNVVFDAYIRPICLTTTFDIPWETSLATGWGHTSWGGRGSPSLQKVRLNNVDNLRCYNKYKNTTGHTQLPQGIIESQVCAGDKKGKDTCQGDSGGPLQTPIDKPYCMYELIGVTSFGRACGMGYPGVYTRISHFLPWIVDNVWPK